LFSEGQAEVEAEAERKQRFYRHFERSC